MLKRTFQFIPGNSPAMLVSAPRLGADAVILDLEDAISIEEKDAARTLVRNTLANVNYKNVYTVVRINPTDSIFWKEDIKVIQECDVDAILLPKASVESLNELIKEMKKKIDIIALIESPDSVLDVRSILKVSDQVIGCLFGAEDYSANMQIERTKEGREIEFARNLIAISSKAEGKFCIDTPWTDTDDLVGLEKDTRIGVMLGFDAKSSIAPRHIDTIHEVLSPTEEEVATAKEILELNEQAIKDGLGVFSYNGKMVDKPIIMRCERTIAQAKLMGMKI